MLKNIDCAESPSSGCDPQQTVPTSSKAAGAYKHLGSNQVNNTSLTTRWLNKE